MAFYNNVIAGASGATAAGTGELIERSLRFHSSDETYLNKTVSGSGNRKSWTWSGWIKRAKLGVRQEIFSAGYDGTEFCFAADDTLRFYYYKPGQGYASDTRTTIKYRDTTAWYHVVLIYNSPQAEADRVQIYVNGVRQPLNTSNAVGYNEKTDINAASQPHYIGRYSNAVSQVGDYYLSEINFVDGQSLTPSGVFAETDSETGAWNPIKYDPATDATTVSWSSALPSNAAFQDSSGQVNSGTFANMTTDDTNYVQIQNNHLDIDMGETIPAGRKITFKFTSVGDDQYSADYFLALSTASNYSSYVEVSQTKVSENTSDVKTITLVTSQAFRYLRLLYEGGSRTARVRYLAITGATKAEREAKAYGTHGFHLDFKDTDNLGNDANGSNNYTANNFVAVASTTNYTNISTLALVGSSSWNSSYQTLSKIFDGSGTGVRTQDEVSNKGESFSITFNPAITLSNQTVSIDTSSTYQGMFVTVNGSDGSRVSGSDSNTTTLTTGSLSGSLSKITVDNGTDSSGRPASIKRIRIGGVELLDPVYAARQTDSVTDTPLVNFATINSLADSKFQSKGLTNGNLDFTGNTSSSSGYPTSFSTIGMTTGKFYCEVIVVDTTDTSGIHLGVCDRQMVTYEVTVGNTYPGGPGGNSYGNNGQFVQNNSAVTSGQSTYTGGDVIGIAYDADAGKLFFSKNGTWLNNANPATGANPNLSDITGKQFFAFGAYGNRGVVVNFGQRAFLYTKPENYTTLSSDNLTDGTIQKGNQHFDISTWVVPSNNADTTISDLAFAPDWVITKNRSQAYDGFVYDRVRGDDKYLKLFSTNQATHAEGTDATRMTLQSNGFELDADNDNANYTAGSNSVAWSWNAGTSNSSISAGSLNSSAYNQGSTNYTTSQVTGNDYNSTSFGETNGMFDGKRNTIRAASATNTFTWTTSITPTTLRLMVHKEGGNTTINITDSNGQRDIASLFPTTANSDVTNGKLAFFDVPVSGTVTEIEVNADPSGTGYQAGIAMVEVDGKVLLDSGVTPDNVPSMASTTRGNSAAGFSIVSVENVSDTNTIRTAGHSLGSQPEFIISKNREFNDAWFVYHKDIQTNNRQRLYLNTNAATNSSSALIWDHTPSVIGFNGAQYVASGNTHDLIFYCFNEIPGFSSFGKYVGGGLAYVHTGFRPRWIMIKAYSHTNEDWLVLDSKRSVGNTIDESLYASLSHAEAANDGAARGVDFLSNGFKIRGTNAAVNGSNYSYIYAAFAEMPEKIARAF